MNRMVEAGITGVEFIAINTDAQALLMSDADIKLDIGREVTRGLGAAPTPRSARRPPRRTGRSSRTSLAGSDLVFVTVGEGGGTGTGGAPIVAETARSLGAPTVGVVTRPFGFEGQRRSAQAEQGIAELRKTVDALIVIPNDNLLAVADHSLSMVEAFSMADEVLRAGVTGIAEIITRPGAINVDFADVKTVLGDAGTAVMGIGRASGDNRAVQAAERAMNSPLIESSMEGATRVLLAISGPQNLTLHEVNEAMGNVQGYCEPDAQIIFGTTVDDDMGEEVRVTIIAAGVDRSRRASDRPFASAARSSGPRRDPERILPIPDDDPFDIPGFVEG